MWIEEISRLLPEAEFAPPTTAERIGEAERRLGGRLPGDLRQLLLESNGVRDELLVPIIWPIEFIEQSNIEFRTYEDFAELYAPFTDLVLFGDNGGGDQFAFTTDPSDPSVWVWEHETDMRRKVADNLHDYIVRRLTAEGDDWYVEWPTL